MIQKCLHVVLFDRIILYRITSGLVYEPFFRAHSKDGQTNEAVTFKDSQFHMQLEFFAGFNSASVDRSFGYDSE